MIVPSGKRRDQVAQGGLRNQSIYDSDLFANFKFSQKSVNEMPIEEKEPQEKDLKMDELQQSLNESNTLPQSKDRNFDPTGRHNVPQPNTETESVADSAGSAFIDMSKQISNKVIEALGLNKKPGENWQGKTEISNDGTEVTGINIKLTRVMPNDMPMQMKVEKGGPGFGEPMKNPGQPGGGAGVPAGPVTNSV